MHSFFLSPFFNSAMHSSPLFNSIKLQSIHASIHQNLAFWIPQFFNISICSFLTSLTLQFLISPPPPFFESYSYSYRVWSRKGRTLRIETSPSTWVFQCSASWRICVASSLPPLSLLPPPPAVSASSLALLQFPCNYRVWSRTVGRRTKKAEVSGEGERGPANWHLATTVNNRPSWLGAVQGSFSCTMATRSEGERHGRNFCAALTRDFCISALFR